MELGYHLNFRDPDNIALEINAPNDVLIAWLAEFKEREVPQARDRVPGSASTWCSIRGRLRLRQESWGSVIVIEVRRTIRQRGDADPARPDHTSG